MDQLSHRYPAGGAGLRAPWSSVTSSLAAGLPIPPPLPLVGPIPGRFDGEFETAHHPEDATRTRNLRGPLCLGSSPPSP